MKPNKRLYKVLSVNALKKADLCTHVCTQGMEGAKIGIWCAHGEGQAKFPEAQVYQDVLAQDLAPIRCAQAGICAALYVQVRSRLWFPDGMGNPCNVLSATSLACAIASLHS